MKPFFRQYDETHPLRSVIIGRPQGYRSVEAYVEIVNEEQKKGLPTEAALISEFEHFANTLRAKGVEVLFPDYVGKFVYDQLTPRDIAVVIGKRLVICNMVKSSRRYEVAGIFRHILPRQGEEPTILIPPDHQCLLEGGDIIVHKGRLLVGISQRTNEAGFYFLQDWFQDELDCVMLHCRSLEEGENVLHLDCTFNPVGEHHALIYPEGFREIPDFIKKDYHWIEINAKEQAALATNVLSIDQQTVISRRHPDCERVNAAMRKAGLNVIELSFDGAPSTGGSFRCCSLPLMRD